eukprot:11575599-Ditylum_brightwellii.AAC.1
MIQNKDNVGYMKEVSMQNSNEEEVNEEEVDEEQVDEEEVNVEETQKDNTAIRGLLQLVNPVKTPNRGETYEDNK